MFSKIKQWFTAFFTPDEKSATEASSGGNKRDDDNGKLNKELRILLLNIIFYSLLNDWDDWQCNWGNSFRFKW